MVLCNDPWLCQLFCLNLVIVVVHHCRVSFVSCSWLVLVSVGPCGELLCGVDNGASVESFFLKVSVGSRQCLK